MSDRRPNYIGNLPLFIRAQAGELDDLDSAYVWAMSEVAQPGVTSILRHDGGNPAGGTRAAAYYTLHTTAGLP